MIIRLDATRTLTLDRPRSICTVEVSGHYYLNRENQACSQVHSRDTRTRMLDPEVIDRIKEWLPSYGQNYDIEILLDAHISR